MTIQQSEKVYWDDDHHTNTNTRHRSLLILSEKKKRYHEWPNMFQPETEEEQLALADAWCVGSSRGWLVLLQHKTALPLLLNPSSRACIRLPPFPPALTHPVSHSYFFRFMTKTFVAKATVSFINNDDDDDYILVIIYGAFYKLAFFSSNNKSETPTSTWAQLPDPDAPNRSYSDIVFTTSNNNLLLALADDGSVQAWNFRQPTAPTKVLDVKPTMEEIDLHQEAKLFPRDKFSTQLYLVISDSQQLLLVRRHIGNFVNADGVAVDEGYLLSPHDTHPLVCPYRTKHFSVFKLDFGNIKWIKMTSLQDRVLFLGANQSASLPAQAFPGCQPNSIYFTDDRWEEMSSDYLYGGHDCGVFHLQDGGTIKPLIPYNDDKIDPPPIWIVPTLAS